MENLEPPQSIGAIIMRDLGMPPPSPHKLRLIDSAVSIANNENNGEISYHHTVFCQTALPYRHVNDRIWERNNGLLSLSIEAGRTFHSETNQWVNLPLPFGPKARLLQIHLDTQAKLYDTPMIDLGGSMTSFIKKLQGNAPNGDELRKFKNQAAALMGAIFRFAVNMENKVFQVDTKIISKFELWYPRDERQRMLFPSFVCLSDEYFATLRKHAIPLDPRAITAMQHNALMLDIYKWLAQRLCRVPPKHPTFIPWPMVQAQFGQGYKRIRAFREVFIKSLKTVLTQYSGAKVEADSHGLKMYHSRPPILPKELKRIA